jgi:hypothetical protein
MPRAFVSALAAGRRVQLLELPPPLRRLDTYVVAPPSADASFAASELFARFGKAGRSRKPGGGAPSRGAWPFLPG